MENTSEFIPFPKIPRLRRDCVVTEKIDGTSGQIFIADDGTIRAGSRNRWITPTGDNYGFATWVEAHKSELAALGPGRHYGEWWGLGIQRGYGLKEKRFSLFNTGRWNLSNLPACCGVVPELARGDFSDAIVADCMNLLVVRGSIAAPGFQDPEGIVIFHCHSNTMFKRTIKGDEMPKSLAAAG